MKKYEHLTDGQLRAEIEKCETCADKPCLEACPSHCSPADFILATKLQNPSDFGRAAAAILSQNPMGHTCGIVCPDTFCMDACSRKEFDCAVNIPKIQAAILQRARELNALPSPEKPALNGKKVAVIGAGPAGLAATAFLARKGYQIDLFDEAKKPGGACLMIPDTRLPKAALEGDIAYILKTGEVKTQFGKKVDKAEKLLTQGYDAVLLAVGEPDVTKLGIIGERHAISSIEYLRDAARFKGKKKVAVIGGGAVAADCAVTAREQGALAVEMFVRRTIGEMPLTSFEREMLIEAGIDITTRTRVQSIVKAGRSLTLKTCKVEPGAMKKGRPTLQDVSGTAVKRRGFDLVVLAIGTEWKAGASKTRGIFHAGDCVEGSSTVVEAAASGKNAAAQVDSYLSGLSKEHAKTLEAARRPGSRSRIKSRLAIDVGGKLPASLETDFFGIPISSPFLLSAAPATDGLAQMKRAYDAGWAGAVMKTAFDNLPIHIPGNYMVTFGPQARTHGNADNVSGHPLDRVCGEVETLRRLYPDRLTMASTGGPVTGRDESDAHGWQSNTKKLERAGAMGVEYSLSCPQGGDGTEGEIVSQSAEATAKVIDWVMQVSDPSIPKLFKLSAAVTSMKPIMQAVRKVLDRYPGKKAGVTLANSFPVLAFRDAPGRKWKEGMVVGMSGEGVVPISYLTLANVAPFGVTVSGNGGVMDYLAAANFLALGARTVQVCTVATRYGIEVVNELNSGLSHYIHSQGLKSVRELIGRALPHPVTGFTDLTAEKQISAVHPELCQSCGNCTRCPYIAITLNAKGRPVTDASRCIGCSICVQQCFAGAMFMRDRTPRERELLEE